MHAQVPNALEQDLTFSPTQGFCGDGDACVPMCIKNLIKFVVLDNKTGHGIYTCLAISPAAS